MNQRHEIKVVCEDQSHVSRRAILARLEFTQGDEDTWRLSSMAGAEEYVDLETGKPVKPSSRPDAAGAFLMLDTVRTRLNVTCPLCGLTVQAREDTLSSLLAQLVEHGVLQISLTALAARLS